MTAQKLAFGPFVLDLGAGALSRHGAPVPTSYRGLLLLTAFLKRPGDSLSKSDLMETAWPGLAVEESNLSVQIASLRKLLGETPEGSDWIATVPRVGYRFAGAVEPLGERGAEEPEEAAPSIAVLPFENLSQDVEQQYFADGLAEDIITRLSRLRWLFVSARNSSFTFRGKPLDVREIGRALGVRYVLNGSVRRSGQRLRIGAQLSDAASGGQVWAERYDVELADFLSIQDEIAGSVIGAIEPQLYAAEHQRFQGRRPESLDAWGYVMKAMPYVWTWLSAKEMAIAQSLLTRALEIRPDYPRAMSLLAWTRSAAFQLGWTDEQSAIAEARMMAQKAIQADPDDPWPHFAAGYVHMVSRGFDKAVAELTEAIDLNPSFAFAHMILGCAYGYGGMPADGLHHLALATRLSPRDFTRPANYSTCGLCCFVAGRFDEAADWERRAVELYPDFGTAWRTYAAAAGMAGRQEEAAQALREAKRLQPTLSAEWVERFHPIVKASDRAVYIQGLRAAGLE
jgi:TolB-like protein/Tfp pilus assembly protein PilF